MELELSVLHFICLQWPIFSLFYPGFFCGLLEFRCGHHELLASTKTCKRRVKLELFSHLILSLMIEFDGKVSCFYCYQITEKIVFLFSSQVTGHVIYGCACFS
jgi:hypothetical protein